MNGNLKLKPKKSFLEKRGKFERAFFIIVFIVFFLYALSLIVPVVWLFLCSLKSAFQFTDDIAYGRPFALPDLPLRFANYVDAFFGLTYIDSTFAVMFFNTIWITVISTFGGLLVGATFAYVLSRFEFRGRAFIYGVIIFTMTIPIGGGGSAGMKLILDVGLYDNPLYVLVTCCGGTGFPFMMFYGAFKNLPKEYSEAVYMDGGGEFTLFYRVMFPFVIPVFVSLFVIHAIEAWNNYQFPMLYLPSYPTLASGLFLGKTDFLRNDGGEPVYYAAIVITCLPLVVMYCCFSNIITANYTVGGIKG